jgi:2-hydroxy-3-keto-5-methylthiopentenyl-1-phosphate phosphatase
MGINVTGDILILCDFDGTICNVDMGNEILNRFTGKGWDEIDRAYCTGKIGSRDAYDKASSLFTGTKKDLLEYARSRGKLDAYFPAFYAYCMESGMDLKIVSDGLDIYIDAILRKYKLEDIEVYTNFATFHDGRLSIEFPRMNKECAKCGTCKKGILTKFRSAYDSIIYVGDGHSDFCPSKNADLVFAKGILHMACAESGIDFEPYENFKDVHNYMMNHISARLSAMAIPHEVGRR